ncbi:uncharacterized protein LOC133343750 isoform X3 [Lethenteron reissneri]|uniref:uncharacterized protein LOC133343750 isoform X3 n=1 Tax=Lethenteron reissneri TaxID=7753 RepID=UPI002AB75433|nr:uncharacterized protein LOC133343750 isoform X3 [Lethenteron reissneri]
MYRAKFVGATVVFAWFASGSVFCLRCNLWDGIFPTLTWVGSSFGRKFTTHAHKGLTMKPYNAAPETRLRWSGDAKPWQIVFPLDSQSHDWHQCADRISRPVTARIVPPNVNSNRPIVYMPSINRSFIIDLKPIPSLALWAQNPPCRPSSSSQKPDLERQHNEMKKLEMNPYNTSPWNSMGPASRPPAGKDFVCCRYKLWSG